MNKIKAQLEWLYFPHLTTKEVVFLAFFVEFVCEL